MRLMMIQLSIVATTLVAEAGPAEKAISLKLRFGGGVSSEERVVMDAFEIKRTLDKIQENTAGTDVRTIAVDPRRMKESEGEESPSPSEPTTVYSIDPNMQPELNLSSGMGDRRLRAISPEELYGKRIRPTGPPAAPLNTSRTDANR